MSLPIILPDRAGSGRRGDPIKMPLVPTDELIDTLVQLGQPRRHAEALKNVFQLRVMATMVYYDVKAIEQGVADSACKQRVEFLQHSWGRLRQAEKALGNDPEIGSEHKTDLATLL